jgi:RNA-directed DNA polymerase
MLRPTASVDGITVEEFPVFVRAHWPAIRAAERVKASITRYLTTRLALVVNEQQSRVVRTDECVFLGFTFRGSKLRWSDRAFADFRHRVGRLTGRSWGVSMGYRLSRLAQYLRGWMAYFGISEHNRPVPEIDHWIRRRIRICYWKQWRRARTKVQHLLALGTGKPEAILTAISRKSYWHLSKTLATRIGMTNTWLASQGLLSVRGLWLKAHGHAHATFQNGFASKTAKGALPAAGKAHKPWIVDQAVGQLLGKLKRVRGVRQHEVAAREFGVGLRGVDHYVRPVVFRRSVHHLRGRPWPRERGRRPYHYICRAETQRLHFDESPRGLVLVNAQF